MAYTDQIPDLDFTDLLNVPSDFTGAGKYVVVVSASESALEFVQYVAAGQILEKELLQSTPTNNQILVFNATSDKWEAVDHSHTEFVQRIGDSMLGFLTLHADPVNALHAATKQYVDAIENEQGDQNQATKEPTGFERTNEDTVYTWSNSTRVFTIAPTGASYTIWFWGTKFVKTGLEQVTLPNSPGLHSIYFDENGVLQTSQVISPEDLISDYVIVAYVYWSVQDNMALYVGDERHGLMPWQMHLRYHRDQGSSYISGMNLGNITADGNGNLNAHAQFSITSGIFDDEDIRHYVPNVAFPATVPVFYLSGSPGYWRRLSQTAPVINYGGTGRVAKMVVTGSTWSLAEIKNNDYFLVHIFSTNDPSTPYVTIAPTTSYDNVGKAESAAEADLQTAMLLPDFPVQEFIPMVSLIYQTSSAAANTFKARIVSVPSTGDPFIDWRGKPLNPQATISHYSLIDRAEDGQHPASAIYTDVSGFNGNLQGVDNDVQAALDALDDLIITQAVSAATSLGTGAPILHGKNANTLEFHNIKSNDPKLAVSLVSNDVILTPANFIFHAFNAAGGISLVSSAWADLTWTDEVRKDTGFTHSTNSAEITFTVAGDYLVTVDITTEVTIDDRTSGVFRMMQNGVEISGTRTATYQRLAADPYGQASITRLITVSSGDIVKIQGYSNRSSAGVRTLADGCRIYIERK